MIAKVRFDGTFDIDYDDGEKEERVEKELIRAVKGGGIYPVTQTLSLSTHYDTYTLSINTLYDTCPSTHSMAHLPVNTPYDKPCDTSFLHIL